MLILDIFAENERYDVKQNAHNPQPENIYDLHSIFSFIVKLNNQFSWSLWDDELLWNLLSIKTFFPKILLNASLDDLMIAIAWTELKLIHRPISVSIITKIEAMEAI